MNKFARSAVSAACLCSVFVIGSGCTSMIVDAAMAKHGYHKATRAQMLAPTRPSFPTPEAKASVAALPREKVVGKWETSFVLDSRTALLSMGYDGPTMTMTTHQTYWFFEDGTSKTLIVTNGKETTWNGNWDYVNGILTISGSGADGRFQEMPMNVLWYGDDEFELRMDVPKYEQMLKVASVKSVTCRCEPCGILHTQIIVANTQNGQQGESATVMVQSPQIYERTGAAE